MRSRTGIPERRFGVEESHRGPKKQARGASWHQTGMGSLEWLTPSRIGRIS